MSLYDKLNDDPRVQNCFPKFIAHVDRKHIVLAEVVNGQVYLTHDGEAFFADEPPAPVEDKPAKKPSAKKPSAKKAAPVEVPEVEADDLGEIPDFLDDLDVGE